MSKLHTYDPAKVKVTFNGVEFEGFTEATFAEEDGDIVDSSPNMMRASGSGTVTLTLVANGIHNNIFSTPDWVRATIKFNRKERRRKRLALWKKRGRR